MTDAEGHITTTRYWPDGKVWRVIDANDANSVTNTYYGNGSLKNVKDAKGNTTWYEYNGFMGLKKTTYPDTTYEEPTYDQYRRVVQARGRSGQTISLVYDGLGRVKTKTVKDPNDFTVNTIHYRYDISGKLVETIDNTGTTRNSYDSGGRLIRVVYPGAMSVAYEYDVCGNRTKLTYPDASYVTYGYDELNRLTCVRNQSGTALAQYTYDGRSRRTGLAYPNGAGIAYSYDAASRLLYIDNQTNSGQHKYAYTYDKVGNRMDMTVTSPSGVGVHLYDYDKIYQVTSVDYPAELAYLATDSTFTYDDAGNRTSVIDGGGTTPYVANALNQYTSANGTYYQYDTSGNMIYDGHYVFDYDPENRLNKVKRFEQGPTAMALACDTTLTFTSGGDAQWFTQTQEHYFEGDAAQSGDIADSQQSWMQATVSGTGYISFWWKVSSDGSGDYLRFYIDDQLKEEHGGVAGWNQSTKYYVSTGGSHTLKWVYIKNSTGSGESDCAWVDKILWEVPVPVGVDKGVDSLLAYTSGGNNTWAYVTSGYYGGDSAQSGYISDEEETWMQTTVEGSGTFKFWWKVSSELDSDYLEFYIDDQLQSGSISGTGGDWAEKTYNLGTGSHTLRWRYVKDAGGDGGEDCGWVDHVQWSEPIAEPPTNAWRTLTYTYDPSGRRIEKKYDDTLVLKYLYDGGNCLAEYDSANNLRRKYIFGPAVDEPICMIEGATTNYYHFDALGSIIALTDESGDAVQAYEYDVYGRAGATDPDHTNRFMFTGREFDKETGLYYYRARYYNAEIGRFLQTDPVGYKDGVNWYRYCGNNPLTFVDPTGMSYFLMSKIEEGPDAGELIRFTIYDDIGNELRHYDACGVGDGCRWLKGQDDVFTDAWLGKQDGLQLAGDELTWWYLQAINQLLGGGFDLKALENAGYHIVRQLGSLTPSETGLNPWSKTIHWSAQDLSLPWWRDKEPWETMRDGPVAYLAHELQHAADQLSGANLFGPQDPPTADNYYSQKNAIRKQNIVAMGIIGLAPKHYKIGEWRIWPVWRWTKESYLRPGGFPIDEPAPTPPWEH